MWKIFSSLDMNKVLIFFGISLFPMVINFDMTTINLALVEISRDLNATLQDSSWVLNGYFITLALSFVIAGKLSDAFGERYIFWAGCLAVILGSLIAGFSRSIECLILGRLIQGLGGGFGFSVAMIIITQQFPDSQKGKAVACVVTLGGLAQGIGPFIAGSIIHAWGWAGLFFFVSGIAMLAFCSTVHRLPAKPAPFAEEPFDFVGALLFCLGVIGCLVAINTLGLWSLHRLYLPALGALGLVFILLLLRHIRETKFPLISPDLHANRNFLLVLTVRGISMSVWSAFLFSLPHYLQILREMSVTSTANLLILMTITFGLLSPFNGMWIDRIGSKKPCQVAMALGTLAFVLLACMELWQIDLLLYVGLFLFGIHSALIVSSSIHAALQSLPEKMAGSGMGIFYTLSFSGATIGVAVSGAIFSDVTYHQLWTQLPDIMRNLSETQLLELQGMMTYDHTNWHQYGLAEPELTKFQATMCDGLSRGFVKIMALCAGISLIGFLCTQNFSGLDQRD